MNELLKIKDDSGLELIVTDTDLKDYEPLMGGDSANPTWEDYLAYWNDETKPKILLIKKAIEQLDWIGETGGNLANDTLFVFSDGVKLGFSWRAWGDLMQAIVNKQEGYMKYYM